MVARLSRLNIVLQGLPASSPETCQLATVMVARMLISSRALDCMPQWLDAAICNQIDGTSFLQDAAGVASAAAAATTRSSLI